MLDPSVSNRTNRKREAMFSSQVIGWPLFGQARLFICGLKQNNVVKTTQKWKTWGEEEVLHTITRKFLVELLEVQSHSERTLTNRIGLGKCSRKVFLYLEIIDISVW